MRDAGCGMRDAGTEMEWQLWSRANQMIFYFMHVHSLFPTIANDESSVCLANKMHLHEAETPRSKLSDLHEPEAGRKKSLTSR